MKASRYMLSLYAAMILVPLFLALDVFATALSSPAGIRILEILIAVGLLVYAGMGYLEVFVNKKGSAKSLNRPVEVGPHGRMPEKKAGGQDIEVELRRFNMEKKRLELTPYKVNANRFTTVLDALLSIKSGQDSSLAIRYSCRMGICGSCGMVVNGKPVLACETGLLDNSKDGKIEVEPMQAHPLLKDLVTDFDDFFEKHKSIEPGLYRKNTAEQRKAASEYKQSKEERDAYLPYSYCIMCGLCMDACPVVNSNPKFVGPQALSQVQRYHLDSRDQKGEKRLNVVDNLDSVWGCEFAGACSEVCPKGVDPAAAIQALKFDMFKEYLNVGKGKGKGDEVQG